MAVLTLLDLAQRTGSDAVVGLIEEVTTAAPELNVLPIRTKKGTTYRITRRTGLPTVGFRSVNEGVTPSKSTYKQEAKPMYFFDAQLQVDEAVVKADEGDLGSVLADESSGVMQATGICLGTQTYTGQSADAKGFLGFDSQVSAGAGYYVDATGTGTVGKAWLVWLDPGHQGVHLVMGNDGAIDLGEWTKQQVTDPNAATKRFMAWVNNMSFYIGLAVHAQDSLFYIKNITAAKPLTDALGNQLVAKVPLVRRNGLRWFMNRNTQFLLQNSRSAVGQANVQYPEPPTTLAGVPITVTDSLVDA